jgi:uncharacterized protein (TIGR03435 family)
MRSFSLTLAICLACYGQSVPGFDVASIRPSENGRSSIEAKPGNVTIRNSRLAESIAWAYSITDFQVSGPPWLNELRFDIMAKSESPATEADLRLMLRKLLADRFKLESHTQIKEVSAMVLTVAKGGHKLKPVEVEGSPSFQTGKLSLTGQGATVAQLIAFLSKEIKIPIVDNTGLTGRYDYKLDINAFVTEEMMKNTNGGAPVEAGGIIARAVQEQLGLKVESKKAPVEMLIVDRMEKAPTEN